MTRISPLRWLAFAACVSVLAVLAGSPMAGAAVSTPRYTNYVAPGAMARDAGEPSIGVNYKSGAVFLQAGFETDKVIFSPTGKATWTDVSTPLQAVSLDPILYSDVANGRVFVSQLTGLNSSTSFTDDDGKTYLPTTGGGIPSGVDHQSIGSGPYPKGGVARPLTPFPNAVYYCSQSLVTAFCSRSDTGGVAFGVGSPLFTECDGAIHGHVRVSPDGTVYVPNSNCGGKQGFAVSTDAGLTFTVRTVPGSSGPNALSDPSVAAGADNTTYFGYVDGDGHPKVAVTRDRGVHFTEPVDVGARFGIQNAAFPAVIAGDGTRAAIAFLGTTTPGDSQKPAFGQDGDVYTGAAYHLYIATTYDRGAHWSTVDATGKDPVQRGRICQLGTTGCMDDNGDSPDRNLLDFMDIQLDKQGRVLVGWADGCTGECATSALVSDNRHTSKGVITRQSGGSGLFAQSVTRPVVLAPKGGTTATPPNAPTGPRLAATGLSAAVPAAGLVLLMFFMVLRRRSR